jgi:hypothetical protein
MNSPEAMPKILTTKSFWIKFRINSTERLVKPSTQFCKKQFFEQAGQARLVFHHNF